MISKELRIYFDDWTSGYLGVWLLDSDNVEYITYISCFSHYNHYIWSDGNGNFFRTYEELTKYSYFFQEKD